MRTYLVRQTVVVDAAVGGAADESFARADEVIPIVYRSGCLRFRVLLVVRVLLCLRFYSGLDAGHVVVLYKGDVGGVLLGAEGAAQGPQGEVHLGEKRPAGAAETTGGKEGLCGGVKETK